MLERIRKATRVFEEAEKSHTSAPRRPTPSIAREAVLAMLDPEKGTLRTNADFVVAAALLLELVQDGRLEVSGEGRKVRVTVVDPTPLGDRVLDDALLTIQTGVFGTKVRRLISFLPSSADVLRRLGADGTTIEEKHRTFGIFPGRRYRATPGSGRDEIVGRLRGALLGESVPDVRTTLLLSALDVGVPWKLFVPRDRVEEADRRAQEVRERIGEGQRTVFSAVQQALVDSSE